MKPTVIFQRNASYSLFLKKYDKFLSTFSCNLEKDCVKKNYFHALPPSLFATKFVTCGFWGCHLWLLTLSFVASEPLICHKWEPQSIALTTQKHSFHNPKRCKENISRWFTATCKIAHFSHKCPQKNIFFNRWPSREGEIQNNIYNLAFSYHLCFRGHEDLIKDFLSHDRMCFSPSYYIL